MSDDHLLLNLARTWSAARAGADAQRCAVAPHPDLRRKIDERLLELKNQGGLPQMFNLKAVEDRPFGLNDGVILPPEAFPFDTPPSVMKAAAANRPPLRGVVRVIVVLVDFSDRPMASTQQHFHDLFFSQGVIPTKSVREYYHEVTNGLIDIQGDVVGPFRMPLTLKAYANEHSGLSVAVPNGATMARDALLAADPTVNFTPYDNDGNGYVDAFIVVHAGSGAEQTGSNDDIWSHKSLLDGGARQADAVKVYGYLTVPEDCRIGVCAHELGHLLFGFPDLYDTDYSSQGVGEWCLMSSGSWGGNGDTPVHPCAWCKANQGWVAVDNRAANGAVTIDEVKTSRSVIRLWKGGAMGSEYFLLENRQQSGFDVSIPGPGLLVWHVDEAQQGNTDEAHYKVALMQADGLRQLETAGGGQGDPGDPYPGTANNRAFTGTSKPNSNSYGQAATSVAVTAISPSGPHMTADVRVS